MSATAPAISGSTISGELAHHLSHATYDRFATLVEGLEAADWSRPTDCTAWTVRDMVGHMTGAMRSAASMRVFFGEQIASALRARRQGCFAVDAMTAIQIEKTAALTESEITAECRSLVTRASDGRARTPKLMHDMMRFPVEFGSVKETWNLGYLNDVILTRDTWLHSVDLSRAIGIDPPSDPGVDEVIVADVVAEWARRHGFAYQLTLTGPGGGRFGSGDGSPEPITMDAVEFCRTLSGRAAGEGLLDIDVPF
jgi:uncharacterized protein (TIGR03083 family)